MIGNAIVDIWITEDIKPIFKYEDDLNILRYLSLTAFFLFERLLIQCILL